MKKSSKIKFIHEGQKRTLSQIYKESKKRRGKSRYLLSTEVTLYDKDGQLLPARLVCVRDKSNRKKWIALLSTDMELTEKEIISLYGKRWSIEVFFKMCKLYLKLTGEFRQLSYDAVTAHTTVVMLRYMMLSVEKRKQTDKRSLAEFSFDFYDEADDIKFEQALVLIMELLKEILQNPFIGLSDEQIDIIQSEFITSLPTHLKELLSPSLCSKD